MKTFPLSDSESGVKYAFEIEVAYIGPKRIAKLLTDAPDVSKVRVRRLFGPDPEIHVSFNYMDLPYVVWEPYGDNSRFWIGPKDSSITDVNITPVEAIFRDYRPPLVKRVIGNLLTFRLMPERSTK